MTDRPARAAAEETGRILPAVEAAGAAGALVSVDTYKPEVAEAALETGAAIINDISGGGNDTLIRVAAEAGAAVVLMHTVVEPKTQRWDEDAYPEGIVAHQVAFFEERLRMLEEVGLERDRIVVDSLKGLPELAALDCPLMLAVSRKDFIGAITHRPPSARSAGTFAALGFGLDCGGRLLRVHDVAGTRDFVAVWQALRGESEVDPGLRIAEEIRRGPPRDQAVV